MKRSRSFAQWKSRVSIVHRVYVLKDGGGVNSAAGCSGRSVRRCERISGVRSIARKDAGERRTRRWPQRVWRVGHGHLEVVQLAVADLVVAHHAVVAVQSIAIGARLVIAGPRAGRLRRMRPCRGAIWQQSRERSAALQVAPDCRGPVTECSAVRGGRRAETLGADSASSGRRQVLAGRVLEYDAEHRERHVLEMREHLPRHVQNRVHLLEGLQAAARTRAQNRRKLLRERREAVALEQQTSRRQAARQRELRLRRILLRQLSL